MMRAPLRTLRTAAAVAVLLAAAAGATGCAAVKPYEMEHLADELMTNPQELAQGMRELKWLEAREGSTGGVGGAGGGCACK